MPGGGFQGAVRGCGAAENPHIRPGHSSGGEDGLDPQMVCGLCRSGCRREVVDINAEEEDAEEVDDDEYADDEMEADEDGEEGHERAAGRGRNMGQPRKPGRTEVEEHEVAHIPFRSWCLICLRARARRLVHSAKGGGDRKVPCIAFDYAMIGKSDSPVRPLLVAKELTTKAVRSWWTQAKGIANKAVENRFASWILSLGFGRIILKTDNEESIMALKTKVAELLRSEGVEVMLEESVEGESETNGAVENAIKDVTGMIRTIIGHIERDAKYRVEVTDNIFSWVAEHAGNLITHFRIGADGLTPYQRLRGKKSSVRFGVLGEKILFRPLKQSGGKLNKLEQRWRPGIWLGIADKSGQAIVGTKDGCRRVYYVRRLPKEDAWDQELIKEIAGTPWDLVAGTMADEPKTTIDMPEFEDNVVDDWAPKRLMIRRTDVEKYGETEGCAGCRAILEGRRQNHTEQCRVRLEEKMREHPTDKLRVERRSTVINEYLSKQLAAKDVATKEENGGGPSSQTTSTAIVPSTTSTAIVPSTTSTSSSSSSSKRPIEDGGGGGESLSKRIATTTTSTATSSTPPQLSIGMPMDTGPAAAAAGPADLQPDDMDTDEATFKRPRLMSMWIGEIPEDKDDGGWDDYTDDITGEKLNSAKVQQARREEMAFFKKYKVYRKIPKDQIPTGTTVLKVRWVDVDKGGGKYRSRLVAKEIKRYEDLSLYAATPPLEAIKLMIAKAASNRRRYGMLHIDISRAYFASLAKRFIVIEVPPEDRADPNVVEYAVLEKSMYGTRDAALNWEETYVQALLGLGFVRAKYNPCVFHHKDKDTSVVVHGDDFTAAGPHAELRWLEKGLAKILETKATYLTEVGDKMKVLGRDIVMTEDGIHYTADEKHIRRVLERLGLEGESNGRGTMGTTGVRDEDDQEPADDLSDTDKSEFRRLTMTLNYVAADRADIAFAVKELAQKMVTPTSRDLEKMKRLGRYLVSNRSKALVFPWGLVLEDLRVFTDSDWAGCKLTRKSTSGGAVLVGGVCVKSWSKTQKVRALSSAEAELYAATKGSIEGIGLKSLMLELGMVAKLNLFVDAKATIAALYRRGVGQLRHVQVQDLWLQDQIRDKVLELNKVPGFFNLSDILTKYVEAGVLQRHVPGLGLWPQ